MSICRLGLLYHPHTLLYCGQHIYKYAHQYLVIRKLFLFSLFTLHPSLIIGLYGITILSLPFVEWTPEHQVSLFCSFLLRADGKQKVNIHCLLCPTPRPLHGPLNCEHPAILKLAQELVSCTEFRADSKLQQESVAAPLIQLDHNYNTISNKEPFPAQIHSRALNRGQRTIRLTIKNRYVYRLPLTRQ